MPRLTLLAAAVGLALAPPAWADLTPAEVWADWQAMAAAFGQNLTAEEVAEAAGVLVLRDVRRSAGGDGPVRWATGLDEVRLRQDGAEVAIELPAEMSLSVAGREAATGAAWTTAGTIGFEEPQVQASGEPGAVLYSYEIARITLALDGQGGSDREPTETRLAGVAEDVSGVYEGQAASTAAQPARLAVTARSYDVASDSAVGLTRTSVRGRAEEVTASMELTGNGGDSAQALPTAQWRLTSATSTQDLETSTPQGRTATTLQSGAGSSEGALTRTLFSTSWDREDLEVSLDLPPMGRELPPLDLALGTGALTFEVPLNLQETGPQPFEVAARLGPILLDDAAWDALDPEGAIDRSPGALEFALTGTLAAPDAQGPGFGAAPTLPRSLQLERLLLRLGGAEVSATGEAEFAPSPPFGAPNPVGEVAVGIVGGSDLVQALARSGILPQAQAMAAQMMLGMFARPDGPGDRLRSDIEFGPGERLEINGVRLR